MKGKLLKSAVNCSAGTFAANRYAQLQPQTLKEFTVREIVGKLQWHSCPVAAAFQPPVDQPKLSLNSLRPAPLECTPSYCTAALAGRHPRTYSPINSSLLAGLRTGPWTSKQLATCHLQLPGTCPPRPLRLHRFLPYTTSPSLLLTAQQGGCGIWACCRLPCKHAASRQLSGLEVSPHSGSPVIAGQEVGP